jgi:DNA-directed RNA polymerase specialized sigma24 family protein
MNCRSIPQDTWEHVRQCLIFYFSRRHALSEAEDLAQETLLAVWKRMDYEFEKEEDFLRVCYAFARRILLERYRRLQKHALVDSNTDLSAKAGVDCLTATDMGIFLDEVLRIGKSELSEKDWKLIESAVNSVSAQDSDATTTAGGNARVYLHRARKKLARLTGWRKGQV